MEQLTLQVDRIDNAVNLMKTQLNKQFEDFRLSMNMELNRKIGDLTNTATTHFIAFSNELNELKLDIKTNHDEVNDVSSDINGLKYMFNEFSTSFEDISNNVGNITKFVEYCIEAKIFPKMESAETIGVTPATAISTPSSMISVTSQTTPGVLNNTSTYQDVPIIITVPSSVNLKKHKGSIFLFLGSFKKQFRPNRTQIKVNS